MKTMSVLFSMFFLVLSAGIISAAEVGGGDRMYKPKGADPVFFSHDVHVRDKTYKCSACHYHTFQMTAGSYKMNMEKLNKGEFCGICHNGKRSFDVNDQASCNRCHK